MYSINIYVNVHNNACIYLFIYNVLFIFLSVSKPKCIRNLECCMKVGMHIFNRPVV